MDFRIQIIKRPLLKKSEGGKSFFSNIFQKKEQTSILVVGLDAAGKTTLFYKLGLMDKIITTIPTFGFVIETVDYKNFSFINWDLGGSDKWIRVIWKHYFAMCSGIIFVVDSNDRDRIGHPDPGDATFELNYLMKDSDLQKCPILIFANKQDLPNALSCGEIYEKLKMETYWNRNWKIQPSSFAQGEGINSGLEWLQKQIN